MIKILFLIHDLGAGGAEKVLVSLVNHMDREQFDITVIALFGGGVNEQFLAPHIRFRAVWPKALPGNSKLMRLLTPQQLHQMLVKDRYDVEIAYLEGPSARVVSGCPDPSTKLLCWIHSDQPRSVCAKSFRSYEESVQCYSRFDAVVCVSEGIRDIFRRSYPSLQNTIVRYNTLETDKILTLKDEPIGDIGFFRARSASAKGSTGWPRS